jgi:rhodanese-related sulfurtransferase
MCENKSFSERVEDAKQAVSSVSPQEAHASARSGAYFIDPRPPEAIASTTGLIPGAHNVTLDDIASGRLPEAFADKSMPVITACQGGPMGAIAAHELLEQGFTNVRYVEGGTQGWLDAGFATQR